MDDLEPYLRRTKLAHRDRASMSLGDLVAAHLRTIPFETLDLLLDVPIGDLSWDALTEKLVHRRRGGYCYEHNALFGDVLCKLGYQVDFLTARVEWGSETLQARTHLALLVTAPGTSDRRLVDVGFGGQTLPSPIDYDSVGMQPTRHEPYRIVRRPDGRSLETRIGDEWRSMYVIKEDPQERIDLEVGSWYVSTHPESGFRHGVRAAVVTDDARIALMDETLTVHHRELETSKRALKGTEEVLQVLQDEFGIHREIAGLADTVERELARAATLRTKRA